MKPRLRFEKLLPFLSLLVLFVALAIRSPFFLSGTNLANLIRQTAVIDIMALGMTVIIVAGGIDLSAGSVLGLAGLLGAMAMAQGIPIFVAILLGALAGLVCGLLNGALIVRLRIAPFIVTLGTMGIYRGAALLISNGVPISRLPSGFAFLGEGNLLGVPFALWLLAACALAVHILLERTVLGRHAFAIGSNPAAATYAGIPVGLCTAAVYAIGGLLTGLAGMIVASRLMTGQPTAGQGYELQAIAAVVIGGGSLNGGEGSVTGTLIGAFIMGLLANGADLLGVPTYVQQVVIGAVIILAVTVDEYRKRRAA